MTLWLAGMCEMFPGRLPSEMWLEARRLPVGLLDEVVEAMAYMRAKRVYDNAEKKGDLKGGMFDLVRRVTFELANEEAERRRTQTA